MHTLFAYEWLKLLKKRYVLIALAVVVGFLYTLPNFYGESPAVQVSSGRATVKIDAGTSEVLQALADGLTPPPADRGTPRRA